jgi:hypothetical protein
MIAPRPSFLRHTQRSRIQNLSAFGLEQKFLRASEVQKIDFSKLKNKSGDNKFKTFSIN